MKKMLKYHKSYYQIIIIIFFCCICCSCEKQGNKRIEFSSVDFSFYDGWTLVRSTHIDGLGNLNIIEDNISNETRLVACQITQSELQKLDNMLHGVKAAKLVMPDTIDYEHVDDGVSFNLQVDYYNQKSIKILISGRKGTKKEKEIAYKLFDYLNQLASSKMQDLDTFKFKTRTSEFKLPEPPLEPIEFPFK